MIKISKKTGWILLAATVTVGSLLYVVEVAHAQRGRGRRGGGFDRGPLGQQTISALPQVVATPADNLSNPAKVALGKLLFWDPVLSGNKDVACGTCHHPDFGYAENRDISIGVNGVGLGSERRFASPNSIPFVKRNSQTLLNTAFNGIGQDGHYDPVTAPMFWDLRASSLEEQALFPIKTLEEMRGPAYTEDQAVNSVVMRLRAIPEYDALFKDAFGGGQAITSANLGKALAAFQRSLLANNSAFDRYKRGDTDAMTAAQIRGMEDFERVGCINCHNGPMFSDYKVHVLSIPDNEKLPVSDDGVNKTYAFRTASLRNLAFTAPYMHSGVFSTLKEVINFYDSVRRRPRNQNVGRDQLDPLLRRLRDPDGVSGDLIQFLGALSDDSFDKAIPARVPSGLNPGGRIEQSGLRGGITAKLSRPISSYVSKVLHLQDRSN
jgi:cytochrome c peroxidase